MTARASTDHLMAFDFTPLLTPGLPPPAKGGPVFPSTISAAGITMPTRSLSIALPQPRRPFSSAKLELWPTYGLESGPLGYLPLRAFLVQKLKRHAGIVCTTDEILVTSGSLQAIDLVNALLLAPGDTVLIEQESYGGALTRLSRRGVNMVGIPLDAGGMRMDALAAALDDLKRRAVRAKYIYTIPTVQNPTGTIMEKSVGWNCCGWRAIMASRSSRMSATRTSFGMAIGRRRFTP